MKSSRSRWTFAVVTLVAIVVPVSTVHAGPWGQVARGFEAFGYQFSGQRNILGNGWDINLGTVYNGQNFNFGFAELRLGNPAAPVASVISMGYTTRGIPSAKFSWNTGGSALPYTFKVNNGIQDFTTVSGSVLIDVSTDVNVLGFYDTRIQISNRGTYSTDGFLLESGTGNLAYDIGPIDISGNIYADILAAITQPFFAATNTENPFAKFSSRATKTAALDKSVAGLRARIEAGEILSDEEMGMLVNNALLSAIINGRTTDQNTLLRELLPTMSKEDTSQVSMRQLQVPEPTNLLLLAGGMLIAGRRCRRVGG